MQAKMQALRIDIRFKNKLKNLTSKKMEGVKHR